MADQVPPDWETTNPRLWLEASWYSPTATHCPGHEQLTR